jgi:hypothetical protein
MPAASIHTNNLVVKRKMAPTEPADTPIRKKICITPHYDALIEAMEEVNIRRCPDDLRATGIPFPQINKHDVGTAFYPEGRIVNAMPKALTPVQRSQYFNNRTYDSPPRTTNRIAMSMLLQYGDMTITASDLACSLQPENTHWGSEKKRIESLATRLNNPIIYAKCTPVGFLTMYPLRNEVQLCLTLQAKARFTREQTAAKVSLLDPWFECALEVLRLPVLPALSTRRLVLLLTRNTGSVLSTANLAKKLKTVMMREIKIQFPHLVQDNTVEIDARFDLYTCIPALLNQQSFFMHDHMIGYGVREFPEISMTTKTIRIITALASFGLLNLKIVTLNLENITTYPALIAKM